MFRLAFKLWKIKREGRKSLRTYYERLNNLNNFGLHLDMTNINAIEKSHPTLFLLRNRGVKCIRIARKLRKKLRRAGEFD